MKLKRIFFQTQRTQRTPRNGRNRRNAADVVDAMTVSIFKARTERRK